jgi:diguanylate cyclase (GGDEF)-like protein
MGAGSAIAVPLQTVGLLSTLIVLINGTFEVFVVNSLYGEQYGLLALLLALLCVWAITEVVVLQRRTPTTPLGALRLATWLQLVIVVARHNISPIDPGPMMNKIGMADHPQFGTTIIFAMLYLVIFLIIAKLIIDVVVDSEQRRAKQLEVKIQELDVARQHLREARDAAELANRALLATNIQLRDQASTDSLTGLSNRRHLEMILVKEMVSSRHFKAPLSLVLIDVDNFKTINDCFGHLEGDRVLIEMARLLTARLRKSDLVARWGGDEFIVMLPRTTDREAWDLAEAIRLAVSLHGFPVLTPVTASFGVAQLQRGEALDQWFSRVDQVLYSAKAAGRNSVRLSD